MGHPAESVDWCWGLCVPWATLMALIWLAVQLPRPRAVSCAEVVGSLSVIICSTRVRHKIPSAWGILRVSDEKSKKMRLATTFILWFCKAGRSAENFAGPDWKNLHQGWMYMFLHLLTCLSRQMGEWARKFPVFWKKYQKKDNSPQRPCQNTPKR